MRAQQKDRRDTNPAFGGRKLKLGTFQTNLDSGCVMSDLDGRLEITWPNTVTLAKLADDMDFEALVLGMLAIMMLIVAKFWKQQ